MGKKWFGVLVMVLAFGAAAPVFGAQTPGEAAAKNDAWSEIVSLFKGKKLEAAYQFALRHENDGDPRIWTFLGDCFSFGYGVEPEHRRSFEYYRKAAKRVPYAKYRMGLFHAVGVVVPCDKDKAVELMDAAIAEGYRPSARLVQQTHALLRTEMSEYADPALKVKFPSRSPKFELKWLQNYLNRKVLGYSLRYGGENAWLDLYVYDRGWGVIPNGISELSAKDLRDAEEAVMHGVKNGTYKNFRDRTETMKGVLPQSKLEYSWFSFVYDPRQQEGLRSVVLIFGARGKFFKIRYSGAVEKDVPPDRLPTMVAELLTQLDAALTAN